MQIGQINVLAAYALVWRRIVKASNECNINRWTGTEHGECIERDHHGTVILPRNPVFLPPPPWYHDLDGTEGPT